MYIRTCTYVAAHAFSGEFCPHLSSQVFLGDLNSAVRILLCLHTDLSPGRHRDPLMNIRVDNEVLEVQRTRILDLLFSCDPIRPLVACLVWTV